VFKRLLTNSSTGPSGPVFYASLLATLLGLGVFFDHRASLTMGEPEAVLALHADLARERASPDVREIAHWVIDSRDHAGLPFVVVDKTRARLFAFDALGRLRGSASILLGAARGDGPAVPATPAGRFMADTWRSAMENAIVWVNGDTSVSLHGVSSAISPGRARQRLASDVMDDKRISDGSLHVADEFYEEYLGPLRSQASVAYVLPEVLPMHKVFSAIAPDPRSTDVAQRANLNPRSPS